MSAVPTALRCRTTSWTCESDLLSLLGDPHGFVWLREGEGFVAWGEHARIEVGTGPDRFARARTALRRLFDETRVDDDVELPGTGPLAFGALTFDAHRSGSALIVPQVVLGRRGGRGWLTTIGDAADPVLASAPAPPRHERVRYEGSSLPELRWMAAVTHAARAVEAGALEKVVLARDRRVWSRSTFDARYLAGRLTERFPTCWTFAVDGLVGASPELLLGRSGRSISSRVLAGSAARGGEPALDRRLGAELLASEKDLAEHRPAVARVRDVLRQYAPDLHGDPAPKLLRLPNLQHLATELRGTLSAGDAAAPSAFELAGALHPTPAVCGSPTGTALAMISELEAMDRARYAGPVGWVDARGDGEWCIALRCAELDGSRARLFAGAGIVGASLPEAELEETRLKLRAMQSAFDG